MEQLNHFGQNLEQINDEQKNAWMIIKNGIWAIILLINQVELGSSQEQLKIYVMVIIIRFY